MDRDILQEFLDRTSRAGIHNAVLAKVNAVEQEMEKELNQKRERLRTVLSMEEQYYTDMLREMHQRNTQEESQKNYDNFEKMQNDREMERREFVELKRKQQHLLNCHELRPRLQQAMLEESKMSQLQQIEEKRRLKQIEQDEENMWVQIQRQIYEDRLCRERMEKSIQNERNACTVKCLDWQVANKSGGKTSKQQEIEEERRLNALKLEELKRYDAEKGAEMVEKRRQYARDCKLQIELRQNAETERKTHDLYSEKMLAQFIQKELVAAEAKKISDKERQKVETEHFLNYVEQQRIDKQLTEQEEDELLNAYRRKIEEEAYKERRKLRGHQRMIDEEVYAYQSKQIAENRDRNLRELHEKRQGQLLSQQIHRKNMELEEAAMRLKRQQSNELREHLMEQIRAREQQSMKGEQPPDVQNAQHVCDVGTAISLHPNYRQILSFNQK